MKLNYKIMPLTKKEYTALPASELGTSRQNISCYEKREGIITNVQLSYFSLK